MKVSLKHEFRRLTDPRRKPDARRTDEIQMITAAIRTQDYGTKSLIPILGLYFGMMAFINCLIARAYVFKKHPATGPATLGGFIGVFGFFASVMWLLR